LESPNTEPTTAPEAESPADTPQTESEIPENLPGAETQGSAPVESPQGEEMESAQEPAATGEEPEEDFDALLEQYDATGVTDVDSGDLVLATIVDFAGDSVLIDLGDKTEGIVPIDEFKDSEGNLTNQVGDRVDVLVLQRDAETGQVTASRRRAVVQAALAQLDAALAGDDPLRGKVTKVVKNGLLVNLGIDCFMPASHVDIRRVGDLQAWIGQEVDVMVLELHRGRKRAVVSRRSWLERRQKVERDKFFASTQVGDAVTGKVKNITDFGVFLDLGGFDGLIPRDELSWERGLAPSDACTLGDDLTVQVISLNPETGKITLSRKRSRPDPWSNIEDRYQMGEVIKGQVVNLTAYGAFVRIEEGLTGLIHASDMSWGTGRKRPQDFVQPGDHVKAQILEINAEKRRLSLGLKQITSDPWAEIEAQYPVGTKIKGTVTSVTNFGIFVQIQPDIEGLIHQSDLTWERKSTDPRVVAKAGDEIEAVVLRVDRVNRKISLGHKQLSESPYVAYAKRHPMGSHVTGRVSRLVSFGVFVDLGDGVEGLIHISHLGEGRVEKVEDVAKVGDEISAKILKVEARREKINLSRRSFLRDLERKEIAQYTKNRTHGGANLGEAFKLAGLNIRGDREERTGEAARDREVRETQPHAPPQSAAEEKEAPAQETPPASPEAPAPEGIDPPPPGLPPRAWDE
jgi:small subunit ribosomal protein S1